MTTNRSMVLHGTMRMPTSLRSKPDPGPKRAAGRDGKTMIGAYLDKEAVYTIQELLLRLTRERGEKVTMQEAIEESLTTFCDKHGVQLKPK